MAYMAFLAYINLTSIYSLHIGLHDKRVHQIEATKGAEDIFKSMLMSSQSGRFFLICLLSWENCMVSTTRIGFSNAFSCEKLFSLTHYAVD